jgi:hypothetical protein
MEHLEQFESDDILYHYTKTTTALEYILHNKRLRLSDREDSRDPIESITHRTTIIKDNDGLGSSRLEHYVKFIRDITERMKQLKQVCFCRNNTSVRLKNMKDKPHEFYGCMKPRMWEQYADNYNGVCLVFSKAELLKQLNENYKYHAIKYVTYSDLNKKENKIVSSELSESNYETCLGQIMKKIDKFIFHKHKDYKGENEYRICSYSDKILEINIESAIKGIIVSGKNSQYFKEQLCVYGNDLDIDVLLVDWKSDGVKVINLRDQFNSNKRSQAFALAHGLIIPDTYLKI